MSLFSNKKTKTDKVVKKAETAVVASPVKVSLVLSAETAVLVRPHITEKAGLLANQGVYTFEVTSNANERSVIAAVKAVYKVTPLRVSLMPIKIKTKFARGRRGTTGGGKKAYVYLKKGDTIEFI